MMAKINQHNEGRRACPPQPATGHAIADTSTASEGDEPDAALTRDLDLQIAAE